MEAELGTKSSLDCNSLIPKGSDSPSVYVTMAPPIDLYKQ